MTTCAALAAIYVALKYVAFDVGPIKFSFSPIAVLIGAMLFGPWSGMIVGIVGEGIIQLLTYGLSVTTPLWILPVALRGLMVGWYAQRHDFRLAPAQMVICILITGMIVTLLNTVLLYVDGMIYGYGVYYTAYAIIMRFVSSAAMTAVYCLLLPKSLNLLRRALRRP